MNIEKKAFLNELKWTGRFIEKKSTIPILTTVAIITEPGTVALMGTDLEVGGISRLTADTDKTPWGLTVPIGNLIKYLEKVTEDTITLTPHIDKTVTPPHDEPCDKCKWRGESTGKVTGANGPTNVTCDQCKGTKVTKTKEITTWSCSLQINHGDDGEVTIQGMSTEAFPVMPLAPITTYITGLDVAAPRAAVSISKEESRFALNGACLNVKDGKAQLISTDGHRLGIMDVQAVTTLPEIKTLILARALAEANAMDGGKVYFGMDKDHHIFTNGQRTIVARKLTGNFPDWNRVIPKDAEHHIEFDPAAFDKVLDRVDLFADERSHAIKLHVEAGKLTAYAETCDSGKAKGAVPAEGVNGTNWTGGFNCEYLQDFLGHVKGKDKVAFEFKDEKSPGVLVTDNWRYVVMPIR